MTTFETALAKMPAPIVAKLEAMIRRVRFLLFIRGFFATLAVAIACLLIIMALDATLTLFSATVRWTLTLGALAVVLAAAWWYLFRPLSRRFSLTSMARILEIRHPELQERISTAVELLSSDDPDSIKGSQELIAAVVDSAVTDVGTVDPRSEFTPLRAARFMTFAAAGAGVLILLLALWPQQSWTLLTRAIAPFLNIGNAYADSLIVDPGDLRVATGSQVTIKASIQHKKLERAELRRKHEDGSETVERMTLLSTDPDGTKHFSLNFPQVGESFTYRVRAGAALSEYYDVTTVDPPVVESLIIRTEFPSYTGKPAIEAPSSNGEIRAVAHSRITVIASTNRPGVAPKLLSNETKELGTPEIQGNVVRWNFELLPSLRGTWQIDLTDAEGFASERISYPIEVLPDKPPVVQIVQPALRQLRLKPTETLPIQVTIVEDFGLANLDLLVTADGALAPTVIPQVIPEAASREGTSSASLALTIPDLKLTPEQRRLTVQVQARDGRPAGYDGPGIGLSETLIIELDQGARSLADQAIETHRRAWEENVREAEKELREAKENLRATEQELNRSEQTSDKAREELDEFTQHTEAARERLTELAAQLDSTLFKEQASKASEINQKFLDPAQEKAALIPLTDTKSERVEQTKEAARQIDQAINEVRELAQNRKELEENYRAIAKLNELANRQQEVAQRAEQLNEPTPPPPAAPADAPPVDPNADPATQAAQQQARQQAEQAQQQAAQEARQQTQQAAQKLEEFRNQQKSIEQQLAEMLKDNAAALGEVLEEQKEAAQDLAAQASALATEQEKLREISEAAASAKSEKQQETLREQLLDHLLDEQKEIAQATQAAAAAASEAAKQAAEQTTEEPSALTAQTNPSAETPNSLAQIESTLALAAKQTEAASEGLSDDSFDEASKAAEAAAQTLAAAAEATANNPSASSPPQGADEPPASGTVTPEDQGKSPSDPASTAALAERQQSLAAQIEAIRQGDLQAALASQETDLATAAEALQQSARSMENTLQNLAQRSASSAADQAGQNLQSGTQRAEDSTRQLADAQKQQSEAQAKGEVADGALAKSALSTMERSQKTQGQAEDHFAKAATALGKSAQEIGQTLDGLEPAEEDERLAPSENLAEGFNDVAQSSQSQNKQQAQQQSKQAAQSLQQLAQAALQQLGSPGHDAPPGDTPPDPNAAPNPGDPANPDSLSLNETGKKMADQDASGLPPELARLGIAAEDWARFKGAVASGSATNIESDLPAEYRELVGRYFQVIVKEAGKKP
jgi:hypothetical protein